MLKRASLVSVALLVACSSGSRGQALGTAGSGSGGTSGANPTGGTVNAGGTGTSGSSGGASVDTDGGLPSLGGAQGSPGGSAGNGVNGGAAPNAGTGGGTAGTSTANGGTPGTDDAGAGGEPSETDAGTTLPCDDPATYFLDHDEDGYGGAITTETCVAPEPVLPIVDADLSTGVWVAWSGDCNDDHEYIHPQTQQTDGVILGEDLLYDSNCDGVETPEVATEWISVEENCTFVGPYNCTGEGALKNGNRSETIPGANDLCGGLVRQCLTNTSAGPCVFDPEPANGCD